jgi:hypothetical protein
MLITPTLPISIHLLSIDRMADRVLYEANNRFAVDQELIDLPFNTAISNSLGNV